MLAIAPPPRTVRNLELLCFSWVLQHQRQSIISRTFSALPENIMPKRKVSQVEETESQPLRRSARHSSASTNITSLTSNHSLPPRVRNSAKNKKTRDEIPNSNFNDTFKPSSKSKEATFEKHKETPGHVSVSAEQQFWLMKAEPESRFENGVDVAFSISSLRLCTQPEPWDGIRNYVARNNLRAMRRGDLAFFYHSNCKSPGIVGIMEIVREATPDLTAHNPKAAYYDPKDDPENPKWSVVHVEYRREFKPEAVVGLQELKKFGQEGPLQGMQLLRQSRLSVSKVSQAEWAFIMGLVEERENRINERTLSK